MKSAREIRLAFDKVGIPDSLKRTVEVELAAIEASERDNRGVMPVNNQTYASMNRLKGLFKMCRNERNVI